MLRDEYGIHKIAIASRMFGFVVNSFFVERPCPTLIDVPPDEQIYLDKLQAGLGKAGYSLRDIERIIITHPHFDHFGAARTIAGMSGAEIWVGEKGIQWFLDFEKEIHAEEVGRRAFLLQWGAGDDEVRVVDDYYRRANPLAKSVEPARRLREGDLFDLSTLVFTVASVPGHTPWCILFHDVENRIAFSGDFLQTVTSNPLIQRNAKPLPLYNSLRSYIGSLEAACEAGLQIALPGHGEIIADGSERARHILAVISRRRKAILRLLKKPGQTPAEISRRLFPDLLPGRLFNALSEITAHLEILEEGSLVRRVGDNPVRFSAL
ncbi:MAG: Hydroxyacylglutathione hydrolase [Syntrophorhabdus sp. PtaU1.Bin058]|nr:MAG: Hydroxyacylglutathione hydrolase [Syntrophorhabdus sp. PtaU1.Bin058]